MADQDIEPKKERYGGTRALMVGIVVFSLLSAIGAGYFGLRGGSSHTSTAAASNTVTPVSSSTTTPTTTPVTSSPVTSSPATSSPTAATPSTTSGTLADNPKPTAVPGGSFVVISGKVSLTHVVIKGDTLYGIAQWYKLMGGVAALYKWNHSTVGTDPNLIFPGEALTITVPGADIPKISPVWLAETTEEG